MIQGYCCAKDRSFLRWNFRGLKGKENFQYYLLRFYGIITSYGSYYTNLSAPLPRCADSAEALAGIAAEWASYGSYYTDLSAPLPRCADSAEALAGIAAEWASYGSYYTDLSAPLPRCADSAEALAGIAAEWASYGTRSPARHDERMTACKIGKH